MNTIFRAGLILLSLLGAGQVSAHATPVLYEPDSSAIVETAPSSVHIRFSERIDPAASSMRIFAPDGSDAQTNKGIVDARDAHDFLATMRSAGTGTYTVSWQVVSADDGHFTKGGFLFSVGMETDKGTAVSQQVQVEHGSDWMEAIMVAVELLGEAMLLGYLALIIVVWRPMHKEVMSKDAMIIMQRRLQRLILCAGVCIVIGSLGFITVQTIGLASDQSALFQQALDSFILTVTGRYTLYRLIIGLLLMIGMLQSLRSMLHAKKILRMEWILWLLIIVIALLRARVSHAAASSFYPDLSIVINAVHLLFKDLWIGGLVVLFFAYLPMLDAEKKPLLSIRSLLRFSNMLMLALAIGGVTGTYVIWLHLKAPINLFVTHWGGYCVTLGCYAVILIALRLYQQRLIHRSMISVCAGDATPLAKQEAGMIGRMVFYEMLTGLAVLLFSSVLIITTPPQTKQMYYTQAVNVNNAVITFGQDKTDDDQFLVAVRRRENTEATASEMYITLENTDKGIGPIVANKKERFPGGFVFPKNSLTPPGHWTIRITEQEPEQFDAVARFDLLYPDDVDAVIQQNSDHSFDIFTAVMICLALGLVLFAYRLSQENAVLSAQCQLIKHPAALPSLRLHLHTMEWIVTASIMVVIWLLLGNHNHGDSSFVSACTNAGGQWHENVPMRFGRATSSVEQLGCLVNTDQGAFQFVDAREFAWWQQLQRP